jgi:hypothetical protein
LEAMTKTIFRLTLPENFLKMKRFLLLLGFASFTCCIFSSAQNSSTTEPTKTKGTSSLEGKIYYIKTHDVNQPGKDVNDTLSFKNGKLISAGCLPYGFKTASYKVSNQNGTLYFTSTCFSDKEGKITWNGAVEGKNISGKYLWHKEGQNDINYVFTGTQK